MTIIEQLPQVKIRASIIECNLYGMPIWGKENFLLVKEIFYPATKLGLKHSISLVKGIHQYSDDGVFSVEQKKDINYLSEGAILSRSPRKRGDLKWSFLGKTEPSQKDCFLPFFRVGGKLINKETVSLVDLRNGEKRKKIIKNIGEQLPIYSHSHSDFICYWFTFLLCKSTGDKEEALRILNGNVKKGDFWPKYAFDLVFNN